MRYKRIMAITKQIRSAAGRLAGWLPASWRRVLRRRYYVRVVEAHTPADWEWSPFILPLIPAGGHVLDIGANVGYLSKLFAQRAGAGGRVVSVEPIPATYDVLANNMRTLFPATVTTLACCVSDRPGEVAMTVPRYEGGGENYYESHIVTDPADAASGLIRVPARTMAQIIDEQGLRPDFIKIDVEGHELAVIQGAADYLSRHRPPLLIEVAGDPDQAGAPAARLFDVLNGWGYRPRVIRDGRLDDRRTGDRSVDYLFVAESGTGGKTI